MNERTLIKCSSCGKRFPLNPEKHQNDKVIFCPWCRMPYTNSFFNSEWKPNEKWWKEREKKGFSKPFTLTDMRRILSGLIRRG